MQYVSTTEQADVALGEILRYEVAGLDTEFYGCDITEESPVGRSICHVFSVAVPSGPLLPRGFNGADSWVFAASLLAHPPVKAWLEDAKYTKPVHNQPVDHHTLWNHGVELRGGVNTLEMARFWYPNRNHRAGFDLDSMGQDFCGAGKTETYASLFGYEVHEEYEIEAWKQVCSCGVLGCRKRKAERDGTVHEKGGWESTMATRKRKVRRFIPLTDMNPEHPLWDRYMKYAAWDAVLALWIYQLMLRDGATERPYPWSPF